MQLFYELCYNEIYNSYFNSLVKGDYVQMDAKGAETQELISKSFLKNIAEVIKRNRTRKNWGQEYLGNKLGVNKATISNYENAKIDISASQMAYISYVCEFDLSEYTFNKNAEKNMSTLFKELVGLGEIKETIPHQKALQDCSVNLSQRASSQMAKYDRMNEFGEIIPTWSVPRGPKERSFEPITEDDDLMFNNYIIQEPSGSKQMFLNYSYYMLIEVDPLLTKDLKIMARAITRYIASDTDKQTNSMLKKYLEKCQDMYHK